MRSLPWRIAAIVTVLAALLGAIAAGTGAQSATALGRLYLPAVMGRPAPVVPPTDDPPPPVIDGEMRALWVSRYDWTRSAQWPTAADLQAVVNDAARAGFNAIIFQVRAAGDAYYVPGLEPWAGRMNGTTAERATQDPGWDPLAAILHMAHSAGLQVHAWVNVYPAWQLPPDRELPAPPSWDVWPPTAFNRLTYLDAGRGEGSGYGLRYDWRVHDPDRQPTFPASVGGYLWASPACPQYQDHVVAVAEDIVSRYAVDGLHLDNVRYPGIQYSPDPFLVAACGADPNCPDVYDPAWRGAYQRAQVTTLVRRITARIHEIRPGTLVSAAVMPVYVNRWGWTDTYEAYHDYYQDSQSWLQNRDVDALMPMLYTNAVVRDLGRWSTALDDYRAHTGGGPILAGIGVTYWGGCVPYDEVVARIDAARSMGVAGHAVFSLSGLRDCGYLDQLVQKAE